ncbi:MAG: hypothetical protein R2795_18755 [Saprospiraceae bacterium]
MTGNHPTRRNPSESGHLTRSVTGGENHYTIVTVAESPLDDQVIWVGTDDGYLHVSRNGGDSWEEVGIRLPDAPRREADPGKTYGGTAWVSRVEPSHFVPGRCYVTLDNHRYDDMQPYVWVTEDFGQTWTNISQGLPDGWSCYVVREDPVVPELLFVGTETSTFASFDRGNTWTDLRLNMPRVAIHDLVIHPREGDLIAGTHGRSIWIMDDISPLRAIAQQLNHQQAHFIEARTATRWISINTGRKQPHFEFRGENPSPGINIQYWLPASYNNTDSVTIQVVSSTGSVRSWKEAGQPGLNRSAWDGTFPAPVPAGAIDTLLASIAQLQDLVRPEEQSTLKDIRKRFQSLQKKYDAKSYLETWDKMSAIFGRYGLLMGSRPRPVVAPSGTYPVRIQVGDQTLSGEVRFREDPLRE